MPSRSITIAILPATRGIFADYRKTLAAGLSSFWHVADTWANYDKIAPVIDRRYDQWKNPPKKRWWQFWK